MIWDALARYNVNGLKKLIRHLEDKYEATRDDETARELAAYQDILRDVRAHRLAELEEMRMEGFPVKTALNHYFKEA